MEHTGSEVYYLKETEIKLLLAGLGLKQWYGLFSGESCCMDPVHLQKEALNRMLADMYQKGVVTWEGEMVSLRQPYARIFAAMLREKRCITMGMSDNSAPLRCCYLSGRDVILTQKSQREDGAVGMSEISLESWLALVEELSDTLAEGAYLELAYRNSGSGECYQSIRIRQEGIRARRIDWKNNETGSVHCVQEELRERICRLLRIAEERGREDDINGRVYSGGG